jgi:hypothetical protein
VSGSLSKSAGGLHFGVRVYIMWACVPGYVCKGYREGGNGRETEGESDAGGEGG